MSIPVGKKALEIACSAKDVFGRSLLFEALNAFLK